MTIAERLGLTDSPNRSTIIDELTVQTNLSDREAEHVLYRSEGLEAEEIAERMNDAIGTVWSRENRVNSKYAKVKRTMRVLDLIYGEPGEES